MPALKIIASVIQTPLQTVASRMETSWDLRWKTPRSSASMARTKTLKPTQSQREVSCMDLSPLEDRPWDAKSETHGTVRVSWWSRRRDQTVSWITDRGAGKIVCFFDSSVLTARRARLALVSYSPPGTESIAEAGSLVKGTIAI